MSGDIMFKPQQIYFEPDSLSYPLGKKLYDYFSSQSASVQFTSSHNRISGPAGLTPAQAFAAGKTTLVVGIRRTSALQTCRPSADFQLPLVTGCPGFCEYCYLATTMGKKPYIRVYVNIEEILGWARHHIESNLPGTTVFEGAATSDPIPVEPYTGSLASAIQFFAEQGNGRFRFVTKFDDVDSLLGLDHQCRTEIRFSINAQQVISRYEHNTPSLEKRLTAAIRCMEAGYPVGFLVAPVMVFPGWPEHYRAMFATVRQIMGDYPASYEFVTHRFTPRAKRHIQSIYPHSKLDMDENSRRFKFGQFGYGKYLYQPDTMAELKDFLIDQAHSVSPDSPVLYLV